MKNTDIAISGITSLVIAVIITRALWKNRESELNKLSLAELTQERPSFHLFHVVIACIIAFLVVTLAGCSDSPLSPTPVQTVEPPPQQIAPPVVSLMRLMGRVVSLIDRSPVNLAQVTWGGSEGHTDHSGAFELEFTQTPSGTQRARISAGGYLTRGVNVPSSGLQHLDMIPEDSLHFSKPFYENYVRGGQRHPTMIWAWGDPNFYIQVDDDRGERVLGLDEQAMMRDVITRSVPLFTGGVYRAGAIEFGNGPGPERMGWIRVHTVNLPGEGFAGRAHIGSNPGLIYMNRGARCLGRLPADVFGHELGHALGLWHVPGPYIMHPVLDCGQSFGGAPTSTEAFHSSVVYQRPRGNRFPDNDPEGQSSLTGLQGLTVVH
jgi:hypothetical protein